MPLLDAVNMPHRCTIARLVRSVDSMGGNLFGVVIEQTDVPCWQQKAGASEKKLSDKPQITATTTIYFANDPRVTERHLILITDRNGNEAANLDITDVANPDTLRVTDFADPDDSAGMGVLFSVMCSDDTGAVQ